MSVADEIRECAELAEIRREIADKLDGIVRNVRIWADTLFALEDDVPRIVDEIVAAVRAKASTVLSSYDRKVEWKWDTRFSLGESYHHHEVRVCQAVANAVVERLEAEGFVVEKGYHADIYAPIRDEGYTGGEYQGSVGYWTVKW